jgi:hypothetical protein
MNKADQVSNPAVVFSSLIASLIVCVVFIPVIVWLGIFQIEDAILFTACSLMFGYGLQMTVYAYRKITGQ